MPNHETLRAAVIGLGRMGMHHVRACMDVSDINLVAVFDHDANLAKNVAEKTGAQPIDQLETLFQHTDLAVIATPTLVHAASAIPLLKSGVSCLVEKPMAATNDEARAMIESAAIGQAHLSIGHVERFNPAICGLAQAIESDLKDGATITGLSARRINIKADRSYHADAVLDLMIHDLDLFNTLKLGKVKTIETGQDATEDQVTAKLILVSGIVASFNVSRVATEQDRGMVVETTLSSLHVNFTEKTVTRLVDGSATPVPVGTQDPLRSQLQSFAATCQGRTSRVATGQDGLAALKLAEDIRRKAGLL